VSRRYLALIPLALAIGLIAAGCGSDSSGETSTTPSVSIPAVTSPVGTTTSATSATTTSPGTTVTGKGGTTYNPNAPDSATNDIPPKKGSPEAAFEEQCKQQGSCG
jgi:hypothetical protein